MPRHLTTDDLIVTQSEGVDLDPATSWDFEGTSVTVTDDSGSDTTVVTVVGGGGTSLLTDRWIRYIKTGWVGSGASVALDLGAMDDEGNSSFISGGTDLANGLVEVGVDGLYVISLSALGVGALATPSAAFYLVVPTPYGGFETDLLTGLAERFVGDGTPANGQISASIQATVPLVAGDVLDFDGFADTPYDTYDITTYIARIV